MIVSVSMSTVKTKLMKAMQSLGLNLARKVGYISRHGKPVAKLTAVRTEAGERSLGAGRGSVTILSDDWDQPMTGEEAGAFWEGRR